jgi:TonB family protein
MAWYWLLLALAAAGLASADAGERVPGARDLPQPLADAVRNVLIEIGHDGADAYVAFAPQFGIDTLFLRFRPQSADDALPESAGLLAKIASFELHRFGLFTVAFQIDPGPVVVSQPVTRGARRLGTRTVPAFDHGFAMRGDFAWVYVGADPKRYFAQRLDVLGADESPADRAMFRSLLARIARTESEADSAIAHLLEAAAAAQSETVPPAVAQFAMRSALVISARLRRDDVFRQLLPQYAPLVGNSLRDDLLPIVVVAPEYPRRALDRHIEGWVLVKFTVSELGRAEGPVVVAADPTEVFDSAALAAVREFFFLPRIVDGVAVPTENVEHRIVFELAR